MNKTKHNQNAENHKLVRAQQAHLQNNVKRNKSKSKLTDCDCCAGNSDRLFRIPSNITPNNAEENKEEEKEETGKREERKERHTDKGIVSCIATDVALYAGEEIARCRHGKRVHGLEREEVCPRSCCGAGSDFSSLQTSSKGWREARKERGQAGPWTARCGGAGCRG